MRQCGALVGAGISLILLFSLLHSFFARRCCFLFSTQLCPCTDGLQVGVANQIMKDCLEQPNSVCVCVCVLIQKRKRCHRGEIWRQGKFATHFGDFGQTSKGSNRPQKSNDFFSSNVGSVSCFYMRHVNHKSESKSHFSGQLSSEENRCVVICNPKYIIIPSQNFVVT